MLTKMVKEGKGCNIGVEPLGITKVANPRVLHNCINGDLDAMLSGLISLVVLDLGGPSSFGTNAVDARSFCVDCRVVACWMSGWAYKGGAVVVDLPFRIGIGNKSPEIVEAIDAVVGGLEKDRRDGFGETDKIIVGGLFMDGEEERLGCCEG
jgi:hypothetical protein